MSSVRLSQKAPGGARKVVLRLVATNEVHARICDQSIRRLGVGREVQFLNPLANQAGPWKAEESLALLIVSRLADVDSTIQSVTFSSVPSTTKRVIFTGGFPPEAIAGRLMALKIRSSQRVHVSSKRDATAESELVSRLIRNLVEPTRTGSIIDAWVEGDALVLLSPSFDRMAVHHEKLARFIGTEPSRLAEFEIDEDGRFVYWPHADVHLGWKQLLQLIDPAAAVVDQNKTAQFNQRYGAAIRALRVAEGRKQADIGGITTRQLRRIEHGEQTVTRAALEALAEGHEMPVDEYLRKLAAMASENV